MSTRDSILVVDDEEGIQSVLKEILMLDGYTVETAYCGQETLEILKNRQNNFSLILLDFRLPDMDGMELVEKIKNELHVSAPVVFISGAANLSETTLPPGVGGFISKPFDIETLLSLVKKILRKAPELRPSDQNISAVS